MTPEEFIEFRNIKVENETHKRIIKLFFRYLYSVSGDRRMLPDIIGRLLNIDLSGTVTRTACFNGIEDGTAAPYENANLYIRLDNNVRVFVYGEVPVGEAVPLQQNEYVLIVTADSLSLKS